jgi:regulator of chromosome condensation
MSQKIIKIVAGNNHALALTVNGAVLTWGIGEQHQLGRRVSDRRKCNGLMPQSTALLKDFINIGAGADHSFAVHKTGELYGWGLNNFGQTGVHGSGGEEFDSILYPATVNSVGKHGKVVHVDGGNHHSIAVTDQGACLTWGRIDTYVCGLKIDSVPEENIVRNEHDKPKILKVATPVPGLDVAFAAAGSEHCIAITQNGKAYSWGFNAMGQTGQGPAGEDIECATLIDNTAVRDKTLMWAGAGGQYSVLAGNGTTTINGVQYTSLDIV